MAMYFYASRLSAAVCSCVPPPRHRHHNHQPQLQPVQNSPEAATSVASSIQMPVAPPPPPAPSFESIAGSPTDPPSQKIAAEGGSSETQKLEEGPPRRICSPDYPGLDYSEGRLVSGKFESLLHLLVENSMDDSFFFAFILSSRLFIKPHDLLGDIIAVSESLTEKPSSCKDRLGVWLPSVVNILKKWTEQFPYDFRDDRVMAHVRSVTHLCVSLEATIRDDVSLMLQKLLDRLTVLEKHEERLVRLSLESIEVDMMESCGDPKTMAEQLVILELEKMSYIGPEEFVQAYLQDHQRLDTKRTTNLETYVSWFDRLSYLVATQICKQCKSKARAKVLHMWIDVAQHCLQLSNFNSLMAILAGINLPPISRLKKTWSKVDREKLVILEASVDPSNQFSSYRNTLQVALRSPPNLLVPFFSLFVKDTYFLVEECSQKLPNGNVNFESFLRLAKQISDFIKWNRVKFPYEKKGKISLFLEASSVYTENELFFNSFEREPPEADHERENYKIYKDEDKDVELECYVDQCYDSSSNTDHRMCALLMCLK